MGSLSLLQEYTSSEDEENHENSTIQKRLPQPCLPDYGVPRSISREPLQTKPIAGDRVRSFPHEAGNWATYVAIPVCVAPEMDDFLHSLEILFSPLCLKRVEDFHVSLTRVLVLRHHWINGFVDSVRKVINNTKHFTLTLQSLSVYLNDDKTRTFVAIEAKMGKSNLSQIVDQLDECLLEYGLAKFYENRLFHLSILWGLGDLTNEIDEILNQPTSGVYHNFVFPLNVSQCFCKTGNKQFSFSLS